jgi:NAD(P)-dependent dehydrogenase (short-subunit alcohol dehydrogenase family)
MSIVTNYDSEESAQVGIVTGAGSGMGREVALGAAARGCLVHALDISAGGLDETVALAQGLPGRVIAHVCDVSSEEDVTKVLAPVISSEDGIDFLVNCAGIEDVGKPISDLPSYDWDRLMGINLRGTFLTMKAVLPALHARRSGAVVNMGSVCSLIGFGELAAYTASKHAVVGLTRTAVAESARYNVRLNVVCPGPIDTPLQTRAEAAAADPVEYRARQEQAIPQGRYGKPKEVADLILFLISAQAQYINGAVIPIDGGMTATR